jgi:hypothetical protein
MVGIQLAFPGQRYMVGFGAIYIVLVIALAIPYFQSQYVLSSMFLLMMLISSQCSLS